MEKERLFPKVQSFGGVVGKGSSWSSSFFEIPKEKALVATRGSFFGVVAVTGLEGRDVPTLGQTLMDALKEEYYSHPEGPPLPALEAAVVSVQKRWGEMSGEGAKSGTFELLVGALWGRVLYLVQVGDSVAVLLRHGETKVLGERSATSPVSFSGLVESGDALLLGTAAVRHQIASDGSRELLAVVEEAAGEEEDPLRSGLFLRFDRSDEGAGEVVTLLSPASRPPFSWSLSWSKIRLPQRIGIVLVALVLVAGAAVLAGKGRFDRGLPSLEAPVAAPGPDQATPSSETATTGQRWVSPQLFYDLVKEGEGSSPVHLVGEGQVLWVADAGLGQVFRLSLTDTPQTEPVLNESLPNLEKVFLGEGRLYLWSRGKLSKLILDTGELTELTLTPAPDWTQLTAATSYLGNLYFLAPGVAIYKYEPLIGGFGEGANWLKEGTSLSAQAVDLVVDGDIWVLGSGGALEPFTGGEPRNLEFKSWPTGGKAVALYTDSALDNLYWLDQAGRRVVVGSKTGDYLYQYVVKDPKIWSDLRSLWVDAADQTIYLLDGTKIWFFKPS